MPATVEASLHPQYRLLLLFLLALLLPQLSLPQMLLSQLFLLLACFRVGQFKSWWLSFLRLKWLLISIVILYGWFTPGLPIFELTAVNMPSQEGLRLASSRVLLLAALVAAVNWLVKPLSAVDLAQALSRLLAPLAFLGLNTEVFSRRLALTLSAVAELQNLLADRAQTHWRAQLGAIVLDIENGNIAAQAESGQQKSLASDEGPRLASPNLIDGLRFGILVLLLGALLFMARSI